MSEMFGAPSGQIAEFQSERERAMTRLHSIEAQGKEAELAQQQNFMRGMRELQMAKTPASPADQVDQMAQLAMKNGMANKAAELSGKAAGIRGQMANNALTQMKTNAQQTENGRKTIDLMGQFLQGATDQSSWDRGNALFARVTGRRSPYEGRTFSPELAKEVQTAALSAKEAAHQNLAEANQVTLDATRQSANDFRTQRLELLRRQEQLREQREKRQAKAGGKAVGSPTKFDVENAASMVSEQFDNLSDEEVSSIAFPVASRAKALVQANPGLDIEAAMQRALTEMNVQNPPGLLDSLYGMFKTAEKPAPGAVVGKAIPLPADRKLVVGQMYNTSKGPATWTGKVFTSGYGGEVESAQEDAGEEGEE